MTIQSSAQTPLAAIAEFVRASFRDDRQLDESTLVGGWNGKTYGGTFSLINGFRVYRITCDVKGTWTVNPLVEREES